MLEGEKGDRFYLAVVGVSKLTPSFAQISAMRLSRYLSKMAARFWPVVELVAASWASTQLLALSDQFLIVLSSIECFALRAAVMAALNSMSHG